MSAGSIFDSDSKKGPDKKIVLIAAAAFSGARLCGIPGVLDLVSAAAGPGGDRRSGDTREFGLHVEAEELFRRGVSAATWKGPSRKICVAREAGILHLPGDWGRRVSGVSPRSIIDVSKVIFGKPEGETIKLDDYELTPSPSATLFHDHE